jgi:hypothetical protein
LECNAHTFSHRSVGNRISTALRSNSLGLVLRIAPSGSPADANVGGLLFASQNENAAELEGNCPGVTAPSAITPHTAYQRTSGAASGAIWKNCAIVAQKAPGQV